MNCHRMSYIRCLGSAQPCLCWSRSARIKIWTMQIKMPPIFGLTKTNNLLHMFV
ncbi:UNVERIFIED_CONTAM: hypothetical protein GTU68_007086 [Idotea baltica]|nr:hypothetical protein [Idotea baltica]